MVKRAFLLAACVAGLSSCILGTSHREVLLGNYAQSRGDYQEATVHYLAALQDGQALGPWISYDLGNVYHSLGEVEAANRMWDGAAAAQDPSLLFAVEFNRGLSQFQAGKFDDAYKSFREALVLNPSSMDTKINLELSYQKINAASVSGIKPDTAAKPTDNAAADTSRLLEYVKRKESGIWIPAPESKPEKAGPDW